MSKSRPTVGYYQDAIIWHVDNDGVFHWGSPETRMKAIRQEQQRRIAARDEKHFRERDKTMPRLTRER